MGIFTPKNKFMEMMKTTLDTNKYFIENKKEEDNMAEINTKSTTFTANINAASDYYVKNTISDDISDLNNKYDKCKSFTEQQIKLNKQFKNNSDRINRKLSASTDNIITCINENHNKSYDVLDKTYDSVKQYLEEICLIRRYESRIEDLIAKIINMENTIVFILKIYGLLILSTFIAVLYLVFRN